MAKKFFQELDLRKPALLQFGSGVGKRALQIRDIPARSLAKDQPKELKKLLK